MMTMIKRSLFIFLCGFILSACGQNAESNSQSANPTPSSQSVDSGSLVQNAPEAKELPLLYQEIYEEAVQDGAFPDSDARNLAIVQKIVQELGKRGCTALDSENQVDMANPQQLEAFLAALKNAETAEATVLIASAYGRFTAYHLHTESGNIEVSKVYYQYNNECFQIKSSLSYLVDSWQYTDDGYFFFTGSSSSAESYVLTMSDEPEITAWRVKPLDSQCRLYTRQYLLPVGYEKNNLFLVDWRSRDYDNVDFYDIFDKFYPAVFQQTVPYVMDENPNIGAVYQIPEKEFEAVVTLHFSIDNATLRTKTKHLKEAEAYEYHPRGFYELEHTNLPYPEVVNYKENADGTITLTVNAVYPGLETSRAYTHELVILPKEQGAFEYVSNTVLTTEKDYDMSWHTDRLTEDEWQNIYGETPLLTEEEQTELETAVLTAAGQASSAQYQETVSLLGKAGFVSVADGLPMENAEQLEAFYTDYQANRDAQVTVFTINVDGTIDAFTFLHREGRLQTRYIEIEWDHNGKPKIKDRICRDLSEITLTPKGYFIYSYKQTSQYDTLCQYWRIYPLSDRYRELTEKYIFGLSYVNYNILMTDWDSRNAKDILMPCMYEDLCRIHTGKEPEVKNGRIPAAQYEEVMTTYLPVTREQVQQLCGYDAKTDSYPYEMIFPRQYPPFGEVVDYTENTDGTITLTVDAVWIEQGTDCAFTNTIVVQPFEDDTFRYLSNTITPKQM